VPVPERGVDAQLAAFTDQTEDGPHIRQPQLSGLGHHASPVSD
jgi:hypothetical protein